MCHGSSTAGTPAKFQSNALFLKLSQNLKRSMGRPNIKMRSYQYRDSHVKDKTVSPTVLSLTWESPYLGKTVFILKRDPEDVLFLCDQRPRNDAYLVDL